MPGEGNEKESLLKFIHQVLRIIIDPYLVIYLLYTGRPWITAISNKYVIVGELVSKIGLFFTFEGKSKLTSGIGP